MTDLLCQFQQLPTPAGEELCGITVAENYIVARDGSEHAYFLVKYRGSERDYSRSYRLQGVDAVLKLNAAVSVDGVISNGSYAVIKCTDSDVLTKQYFLELCASLRRIIGDSPDVDAVDEGISTIVRIFSQRLDPPRKTVLGLVGELLYIDQSESVVSAINAWHARSTDSLDFVYSHAAVEVKSSSTGFRKHFMRPEQVSPTRGIRKFIVSVLLSESVSGMTGDELIQNIVTECGVDVATIVRLWEVVSETLGSNIGALLDFSFDYCAAASSLEYYDSTRIPAIRGPIPEGVTDVRFISDLTVVSPLRRSECTSFLSE